MYILHKKQPLFLYITLKVMKFIKTYCKVSKCVLYCVQVDEMSDSTDGSAVNVYKP